jgi:HK97 gp10 family phage protein
MTRDAASSGQSIKIEGLTQTLANIRGLGVETDDVKQLNFDAGVIVARKVEMPSDEGNMITTLRVARAVRKAQVQVGRKGKGWYSTFIEYGTRKLRANPFLLRAADAADSEVRDHYERGLQQLINQYNLGEGY